MPDPQPSQRPDRPIWMFVVFGIACCIMLAIGGVFLYGLTLPDTWYVSESIQVDAALDQIVPHLDTPREWTEWSMWSRENDPTLETEVSGPKSGADAALQWIGRGVGRGKLVITQSQTDPADPSAHVVRYELYRHGELFSENGSFRLTPEGQTTRVVWADSGELDNTTARLFRARFTEMIARDYARCLEQLRDLVERRTETLSPETAQPP